MGDTTIEWTRGDDGSPGKTWNPIRGCSLVSEGCRNCYAMGVAARFSGPGQAYEGLARRRSNGEPQWTGKVAVVERHMLDPLKWKEPRRIFVNSMSDLFHEHVSDETIARVFDVMFQARRHVFQVLTKRPERMRDFSRAMEEVMPWPLPNVWLGVSVENQAAADERIPLLLRTPAAVRFLSCEPLLGPVDLTDIRANDAAWRLNALTGEEFYPGSIRREIYGKVDWVIVGGESGRHARPMHPDWARSLRDQCVAAGVPFFFKQWGEHAPLDTRANGQAFSVWPDGRIKRVVDTRPEESRDSGVAFLTRCGKKRAGRELDGRTWDEFPEVRS